MKIFQKSSEFYDLLYNKKNYSKETKFIENFINFKTNNKINILEIGCGTGGHAQEISKLNCNIIGIDSSKKMVQIAKKKNNKKNVDFFFSKIENFKSKKKFDVCLALFHVINYFNTETKLKNFFKYSRKLLKKDGLLIFDFWNGDGVKNDPPKQAFKSIQNKNLSLKRFAVPKVIKKNKQVEVKYSYIIQKNYKKINFYEKHLVRYIFQKELKKLSKKYFKIIKIGKWMTKEKLKKNHWYGYAVMQVK